MRIAITCDYFWESRINEVVYLLDDTGFEKYFKGQNYGSSLEGVMVVFICQNSNLNLKPRIRFRKEDKGLYMDIILNLEQFLTIDFNEKKEIMVNRLIEDIPLRIAKYKFNDFDLERFQVDLKEWMIKIL